MELELFFRLVSWENIICISVTLAVFLIVFAIFGQVYLFLFKKLIYDKLFAYKKIRRVKKNAGESNET